jgi:hypothetical protein
VTIMALLQAGVQATAPPTPDRHVPPIVLEVVQLAANAAILATAIFVYAQVKTAIEHLRESRIEQKRTRALDYIRRWNEASEQTKKLAVYAVCRDEKKSTAEKLEMLKADAELRALVKAECNFFEELGVAHEKELIEKEVAYAFFEGIVPYLHETFRFWIEYRRTTDKAKSAEKLYEHFSALEEEYRKKSKKD